MIVLCIVTLIVYYIHMYEFDIILFEIYAICFNYIILFICTLWWYRARFELNIKYTQLR